jgi:hypothetical protein
MSAQKIYILLSSNPDGHDPIPGVFYTYEAAEEFSELLDEEYRIIEKKLNMGHFFSPFFPFL